MYIAVFEGEKYEWAARIAHRQSSATFPIPLFDRVNLVLGKRADTCSQYFFFFCYREMSKAIRITYNKLQANYDAHYPKGQPFGRFVLMDFCLCLNCASNGKVKIDGHCSVVRHLKLSTKTIECTHSTQTSVNWIKIPFSCAIKRTKHPSIYIVYIYIIVRRTYSSEWELTVKPIRIICGDGGTFAKCNAPLPMRVNSIKCIRQIIEKFEMTHRRIYNTRLPEVNGIHSRQPGH